MQSLVDATGRVIVARGIGATTTNHIAKEAGVGIAAPSQHFAKEDLIEALVQNLTERAVLEATRRFAAFDVYAATPAELLRAVLQIGIRLARADPVVAAIAQDSRYLFDSAALGVLESRFQMLATLYFRHHFRSYPIDDLEVRLHIVSVSAFSTLARHFAQQPPLISDDVLVEELVQMLTPYLSAPRC